VNKGVGREEVGIWVVGKYEVARRHVIESKGTCNLED
jgi:hypothetical protein